MRIIAGQARGIPLKTPTHNTRPTTDRVREAIFSMLGESVEGARVLDLFAGSGSLGLEALSRGAVSALFVDQQRQAVEVIRENLTKSRLTGAHVRQGDVFKVLDDLAEAHFEFDLVFADPPYLQREGGTNFVLQLMNQSVLLEMMPPGSHLILESMADRSPSAEWNGVELVRQRDYGSSRVTWLRRIKVL